MNEAVQVGLLESDHIAMILDNLNIMGIAHIIDVELVDVLVEFNRHIVAYTYIVHILRVICPRH